MCLFNLSICATCISIQICAVLILVSSFFPESVELMNRKSQISILNDLSLIIGNDSAQNVSYCSTTQLIFKVCDEIASAFFLVLNSLWLGNQFAQIMFLKRFAYQVHKPKCLALVPIKNVPKKLIYLQNRKDKFTRSTCANLCCPRP